MGPTRLVARLKALRIEEGLTMAALGKRLGVVVGAIGNYEAGTREPTFELCERWAVACGKSLHLVVAGLGEEADLMLPQPDRRFLARVRKLAPEDRALVEDFARGLEGGDRKLREMIAVQIPLLLESVPSRAGEEGLQKSN